MWWPAIGGLVIGIGGWLDPRVLGVGYDTIGGLLLGHQSGALLASLLLAKALVWAIALGSGTSGGVLAPLLMMGGAVGALVGQHIPGVDGQLGAMVGMAAMMGGTMRSPLTGTLFLLELTHDLDALPALLLGTVAALAITVLTLPRSILTEKLARRGRHIARDYAVDVFELTRVADVMDRQVPVVAAVTSIAEVAARIDAGDPGLCRRQAFFVCGDDGAFIGTVTREAVAKALADGCAGPIIDLAERRDPCAFSDETLHDASLRMLKARAARMPVVSRDASDRLVGYLGRAEILAARQRAHADEEGREVRPQTT
jgi:CBS domain-containing protein